MLDEYGLLFAVGSIDCGCGCGWELGGEVLVRGCHCASLADVGLHLIHLDVVKRGVIAWKALQSGVFIPFEPSIFEKQNLRPIVLLYAAIFIQCGAIKGCFDWSL